MIALFASPASAQLETLEKIEQWSILYAAESSQPKYCGAMRNYNQRAWLHIDRLSTENVAYLTFYADDAPNLQINERVAVKIVIELPGGDQQLETIGAISKTQRANGVGVIVTEELAEMLARGATVSFIYSKYASKRLSLKNSRRALDALRRCIVERF